MTLIVNRLQNLHFHTQLHLETLENCFFFSRGDSDAQTSPGLRPDERSFPLPVTELHAPMTELQFGIFREIP